MVLSDGMVHFLKIKKNFKQIIEIYQNYLVALIHAHTHTCILTVNMDQWLFLHTLS